MRWICFGLLLAACTPRLETPSDATVVCTRSDECPVSMVCLAATGVCRSPGAACVEPSGSGYRAVPNGTPCEAAGLLSDTGVCVVGTCQATKCGDGATDARTETCDDGANNNDAQPNACRVDCQLPYCGDGVEDVGEECDDGNQSDLDGCLATCIANTCGDGFINPQNEACDDGNLINTDGCLATCQPNVCNDGNLNFGVETCEDMNDDPNDGCADCRLTRWAVTDGFGVGPWAGDPSRLGMALVGDAVVDPYGNIYVSDGLQHVIWRLEANTGLAFAYAGGSPDPTFDSQIAQGIPAALVRFQRPGGLALDRLNNLYVSDRFGRRVLKIDSRTQVATLFAGGVGCYAAGDACGDGGQATDAGMYEPADVAVAPNGDVFVADTGLGRVRRISATTHTITTHFNLAGVVGVTVHPDGTVFVSEIATHTVRKYVAGLSTVAGNGIACASPTAMPACGDTGNATSAQLNYPANLSFSQDGARLYIADRTNYRVRQVAAGNITTIAGTGSSSCLPGGCEEGGSAVLRGFIGPTAVVEDGAGDLFVLDSGRVQKLTPSGNGGHAVNHVMGSGSSLTLYTPVLASTAVAQDFGSIALAADGTMFVTEKPTNSIFEVNAAGDLLRVTGTGIFCDAPSQPCGDGMMATEVRVWADGGMSADPAGNLVFFDHLTQRIRRIDRASGIISTIAGNGVVCAAVPYSCGDGGLATAAGFVSPIDTALDAEGVVYVADFDASRVRKIENGQVSTLIGTGTPCGTPFTCGDGGMAGSASLLGPRALAVGANRDVFILDGSGPGARIRRVEFTTGQVTTVVASIGAHMEGLAVLPGANVALVSYADESDLLRFTISPPSQSKLAGGAGCNDNYEAPATQRCLGNIVDVATDAAGNIGVLDYEGSVALVEAGGLVFPTIVRVDARGSGPFDTAFLTHPRQLAPTPLDTRFMVADHLSVRLVDLDSRRVDPLVGISGGNTANGTAARFFDLLGNAAGIAFDANANPPAFFFSDASSNKIYRVTMNHPTNPREWVVNVFAGTGTGGHVDSARLSSRFSAPWGLALDAATNTLYVADRNNHVIRAIASDQVTTVAGQPGVFGLDIDFGDGVLASDAVFNFPEAVAIHNGDIFIADTGSHQVRRLVMSTLRVKQVLGDGTPGYVGEGAPAWAIPIASPRGLAFDSFGNMYVAAATTVRQVLAGANGEVERGDSTRILYGKPPRATTPESATTCLSGIHLLPTEDTLLLTDSCTGFFVRLSRQAL